jgi:hypothetical protein
MLAPLQRRSGGADPAVPARRQRPACHGQYRYFFAEAMDAADVTGLLRVGSIDVRGGACAGVEATDDTTDEPALLTPVTSSKW